MCTYSIRPSITECAGRFRTSTEVSDVIIDVTIDVSIDVFINVFDDDDLERPVRIAIRYHRAAIGLSSVSNGSTDRPV